MNPDFPPDPREALEASLTALLLGELPHEQAAALHQKLAQDAELAKLYERLKHTINLVRETVASPAAQADRAADSPQTRRAPPPEAAPAFQDRRPEGIRPAAPTRDAVARPGGHRGRAGSNNLAQ